MSNPEALLGRLMLAPSSEILRAERAVGYREGYEAALGHQAQAVPAPSSWIGSIPSEESDEEFARQIAEMDGHQAQAVASSPSPALGHQTERDSSAVQRPVDMVDSECPRCKGEGMVREMTSDRGPDDYEYDEQCATCNGTGSASLRDAIESLGWWAEPNGERRISLSDVLRIADARSETQRSSHTAGSDEPSYGSYGKTITSQNSVEMGVGVPAEPALTDEPARALLERWVDLDAILSGKERREVRQALTADTCSYLNAAALAHRNTPE